MTCPSKAVFQTKSKCLVLSKAAFGHTYSKLLITNQEGRRYADGIPQAQHTGMVQEAVTRNNPVRMAQTESAMLILSVGRFPGPQACAARTQHADMDSWPIHGHRQTGNFRPEPACCCPNPWPECHFLGTLTSTLTVSHPPSPPLWAGSHTCHAGTASSRPGLRPACRRGRAAGC